MHYDGLTVTRSDSNKQERINTHFNDIFKSFVLHTLYLFCYHLLIFNFFLPNF